MAVLDLRRKLAILSDAAKYGVLATPTVFINGRLIVGAVPFETYERIVREELSRASAPGK